MVASSSTALDAKEYNATKQAVRQLKLQSMGSAVVVGSGVASSQLTKALQLCRRDMSAALAEHTMIVRTSGIRPGRENILVEHVDAIRESYELALSNVADAYKTMETQWMDQLQQQQNLHADALETNAMQLQEREKDMETWQQQVETQHFEDLERLTHSYDAKVVEIQALCNAKLAHTNETCQATVDAVRSKMKAWKHAFEIKVKDAVHGKIEQLRAHSEHELKIVMTEMDKQAQVLEDALHVAKKQIQSMEVRVRELTAQLLKAQADETHTDEKLQGLQQALAHEQAQVSHFQHLYETMVQSCAQQRQELAGETTRRLEQQAAAHAEVERHIHAEHQRELDTLHERVRVAIATKGEIINRLQTQVTAAMARAHSSEAVLVQLNSDMQTCGSHVTTNKEAFRLDIT
ncbi:hypothetical protein DYB25_011213 [Aphanomyces astaci]|uniref:Uncharacterized protein n=1 Tax=Aphanomyces astaci TaxID=112090 RepID=A0A397C8L2_APHAT|nr:hypothetical protein DYB25_011213 [Aphanomyces astaci]